MLSSEFNVLLDLKKKRRALDKIGKLVKKVGKGGFIFIPKYGVLQNEDKNIFINIVLTSFPTGPVEKKYSQGQFLDNTEARVVQIYQMRLENEWDEKYVSYSVIFFNNFLAVG